MVGAALLVRMRFFGEVMLVVVGVAIVGGVVVLATGAAAAGVLGVAEWLCLSPWCSW